MALRLTLAQLQTNCGATPDTPLYIAIRGVIYDVSKGRDFYGPGAGYRVFAGKEVARALALMSLKPDDCSDDLTGLTERQMQVLEDWEAKFMGKYQVVGQVVGLVEDAQQWNYEEAAC